jgi:PAS domain S-box-containing protein
MEQILRNDEEEYRMLAESITDVFFALDKDLRYTYWNKASEDLTGISAKDAIGKSFYELFPDMKGTRAEEVYLEVLRTGQSRSFVNEYKLEGKQFFFEINAYPTKWGISVFTKDITERKRMEAEVRGLARFPSENPNPVLRLGKDGAILVANPASKLLLQEWGSEVGQVAPKFWCDLAADALSTQQDKNVDVEFGGRSYTFLIKPVKEADHVNLYGRDITERKRAEADVRRYSEHLKELVEERTRKLSESERRFRELADLLPQTVYEVDVKGNFLFLNQAGLDAFGYSQEELAKGLNISQLFVPDDMDRGLENLRRRLSGEKSGAVEYTLSRKDGTTFPILAYSSPIFRDNKVVGLRGVTVDITQRKRMEEEIRASKERLDYVVSSNPAVIYTGKPRADYSDYNIAYMSDRVVEMLGFEPRQFIGHPEFWDGHVHPDDLRRYPMEVPELWKKGQYSFEYRFLHKDEAYRWIREEAKVIRDADGKPVEVMGYWTDVTERKRLETQLIESRRLAAIGETTAMVGHDLRNPLQAITTSLYLGRKGYESLPPEYAKAAEECGLVKWLSLVEGEIEYMDKIVSDLQDYAAPLKPDLSQVNIDQLLKDALLKTQIPSNVNLSVHVEEGLQLMIDRGLMKRIFRNLITNAVQAMPEGGELTIDAPKSDKEALVSFHDTGVGIPQEDFSKLFSPFFTTKAKGQGLGLAVCKRLVEAHGGEITIESKLGEGTTFTIKLPHRRL